LLAPQSPTDAGSRIPEGCSAKVKAFLPHAMQLRTECVINVALGLKTGRFPFNFLGLRVYGSPL
jgi:hypothetical protein